MPRVQYYGISVAAANKHPTCFTNGASVLSTERVLTSIIFGSSIIEAAKLNLNVVGSRSKQFCFTILDLYQHLRPTLPVRLCCPLHFVLMKFWEFQRNPQLFDLLDPLGPSNCLMENNRQVYYHYFWSMFHLILFELNFFRAIEVCWEQLHRFWEDILIFTMLVQQNCRKPKRGQFLFIWYIYIIFIYFCIIHDFCMIYKIWNKSSRY